MSQKRDPVDVLRFVTSLLSLNERVSRSEPNRFTRAKG
jgi:hypothetical protein